MPVFTRLQLTGTVLWSLQNSQPESRSPMVEQIQTTPPYETLVSSGVITPETSKTASSHTSTNSVTPSKEGDTVTLSESARASQLYLQGHTVTQIASLLGLPPATVESDLNITPTSSTTGVPTVLPTTAQSPATQVAPADASTPGHAAASPYTAPTAAVVKAS